MGDHGSSKGSLGRPIYVDPKLGIRTSGRAATIERAKEQFRQSWERVHAKQA
jgi:hypothetical protein